MCIHISYIVVAFNAFNSTCQAPETVNLALCFQPPVKALGFSLMKADAFFFFWPSTCFEGDKTIEHQVDSEGGAKRGMVEMSVPIVTSQGDDIQNYMF